ncbi:MAG: T9SS type A sorting domain-containing protein [Bacteroidales bacterium]
MRNFTQSLRALALIATVLLASASAFAQTVVFEESFDKFTAGQANGSANSTDVSSKLDEYTYQPGWTGYKVYQAGGSIKLGTSEKGWIETPAIELDGKYSISFEAMAWSNDATEFKIIVGGNTYTVSPLNNTAYSFDPFSIEIQASSSSTIRFEGKQASKARFFLRNLKVTETSEVTTPTLTAPSSVAFGTLEVSEESTKEVSISAANLTGDLTVAIAGEGFSTEVATITKEVAEAGTTVAVNFVGTETKDYTGTLTISGGGVEEKVITLSAEVAKLTAATIAELRTFEADNSTVYTLSGEALITFINGRNKFIEDETAAILLFDYSSGAILPAETHVAGAKVSSIQGKLTYYYGLLEFIPTAAGEVVSTGNAIPEAVVATVAEIAANYNSYEARLVKIEACELEQKTIGSGAEGNAALTQGEDEMVLRNQFGSLKDYVTPEGLVDVIGYIGINTNNDGVTNRQIWPRSTADIMVATSNPSVENNYSVYGTQGNIVVNSEVSEVVSVFNITGQLVESAVVTEGTTMLPLSKGLYIVRVGASATKVTVE